MTNADVDRVRAKFASRGRVLSSSEAATFLLAGELLAADHTHTVAAEVLGDFAAYLSSGAPMGFAQFLLPVAYTSEQVAENERVKRQYLVGRGEEELAAQKRSRDKYLVTVNKETIP
jgi:hypothetical protein